MAEFMLSTGCPVQLCVRRQAPAVRHRSCRPARLFPTESLPFPESPPARIRVYPLQRPWRSQQRVCSFPAASQRHADTAVTGELTFR